MSGLNISFTVSAVDNFSRTMTNLNKQTSRAFDSAGQLGAGMTAAGAGIAAGLGMAVKTTADFESAMSRVGALSGATDKDLASLTKTAKDLGSSTSFSATQAAEGMSYLAQAGYDTNDVIASMPGLLNAAAAGQTDLATTADITSNILSGFGLEAAETAKVADVLTKTFTNSNVDLAMLGDTMRYVAPTAKAMGLSLEETAAAAGILGNAGIQGSTAGTSLSMSLTRLASPTKEAAGLMEELGFNAFDSQGKMLPLNEILGNLQKSTANLTDEQRMHAVSTIFGAESMKSMLTLMEAGPDTLSKFTGELKNAGGAAEEIATKQLDNLKGQFTILMSAVEGAAISLGTALLPAVKFVVSGIQRLVDLFNGLPEGVKSTIAIVAALTALFLLFAGPLLILVALIPSITAGFGAIAIALGTTSAALLTTIGIITGVVAAVALIGVGLVVAYNKIGWFREMVDAAWAWIKNAFHTALNFIKGIVTSIMSAIVSFGGEQLAKFKALWSEHGAAIMTLVKNAFNGIVADIKIAMAVIETVFRTVWPLIEGIVKIAWGVIKTVIGSAIDIIVGLIDAGMSLLKGDWEGAWEAIKGIGEDIWHNIEDFFRNIDLVEIGKDIIRGLINGIGSMKRAVGDKIQSIANSIPAGIKKLLGIHSPSRVMMAIGKFIPQGLELGIGKGINGIKRMASTMASATVPNANGTSLSYGLSSGGTSGGSGTTAAASSTSDGNSSHQTEPQYVIVNIAGHEARGTIEYITQAQDRAKNRKERARG
jgi:TP901 family phage tail tape measure protein